MDDDDVFLGKGGGQTGEEAVSVGNGEIQAGQPAVDGIDEMIGDERARGQECRRGSWSFPATRGHVLVGSDVRAGLVEGTSGGEERGQGDRPDQLTCPVQPAQAVFIHESGEADAFVEGAPPAGLRRAARQTGLPLRARVSGLGTEDETAAGHEVVAIGAHHEGAAEQVLLVC